MELETNTYRGVLALEATNFFLADVQTGLRRRRSPSALLSAQLSAERSFSASLLVLAILFPETLNRPTGNFHHLSRIGHASS
jgi:hypothetical protein